MRGDRCELCGEPTYHDMTWPGRQCLWHVCIENGCDDRLAKAVGARGDRKHGRWFHSHVASGRCMSFDWWCQPHNEPICDRIDEEAKKLQKFWRPRGSAVIHADMPTPHGANCQTISYLPNTPTTACVVCGKLRATPHTFHTEDGYTKAHLCCETEDQPGCCGEVTRVWRGVDPREDAGTQEGLATAIRRAAREHGFVHEFAAMLGYQIGQAQPLVEAEKQRDRENTERIKEVAQQMAVPATAAAQNEAVLNVLKTMDTQFYIREDPRWWYSKTCYDGRMVYDLKELPGTPVRAAVAGTVDEVSPPPRSCADCGSVCISRGVTVAPATADICSRWTKAPFVRGDLVRPTAKSLAEFPKMGELRRVEKPDVFTADTPLWPARVKGIFSRSDDHPPGSVTYVQVVGGPDGNCWEINMLEKVETAEGKPDAIIGGQMVERKTSGPSIPQDWKAELPRPALQLRPYRGLLFQPGPASKEVPADGPRYRCTRCEAAGPKSDGSWRCEGTGWSHACVDCHPQEGHFPSTPVCSGCGRPVQAAAPARDGRWYCETCVGFKTLMADTTARIERRQEEREAARKATPPSAPERPYRLMGDFHGPKV